VTLLLTSELWTKYIGEFYKFRSKLAVFRSYGCVWLQMPFKFWINAARYLKNVRLAQMVACPGPKRPRTKVGISSLSASLVSNTPTTSTHHLRYPSNVAPEPESWSSYVYFPSLHTSSQYRNKVGSWNTERTMP